MTTKHTGLQLHFLERLAGTCRGQPSGKQTNKELTCKDFSGTKKDCSAIAMEVISMKHETKCSGCLKCLQMDHGDKTGHYLA